MTEIDPTGRPPVAAEIAKEHPTISECLKIALLSPIKRPVRFATIFAFPTFLLLLITYYFPAANLLGAVFPHAGIGIGGPISAAASYGLVGIAVWLGSALIVSFGMTAWSVEIAIGEKLPLSVVIWAGSKRAIHYFCGSLLTFMAPAIPMMLAMFIASVFVTPGKFELSLSEPRTWLLALAMVLALATLWVVFRLIFLGAIVAMHGWGGAIPSAWQRSRGLTPRLIGLIAAIGGAIFLLDAFLARSIIRGVAANDRLSLFVHINFLNLGAALVFLILVVGILAAHLPSDRFMQFRSSAKVR